MEVETGSKGFNDPGVSSSGQALVKSRKRVIDHGEVFTPDWMINDMLALVQDETERIEATFLEPACGSGKFLIEILNRKLGVVRRRFSKAEFERRQYSLRAVMSVYGIELLEDNIDDCRSELLNTFRSYFNADPLDKIVEAASNVLMLNIVHGDALTMKTIDGEPITFSEWSYLGKGKFKRRDFRFESMAKRSSFGVEGTLFAERGKHEIFTPVHEYKPMSIVNIAG